MNDWAVEYCSWNNAVNLSFILSFVNKILHRYFEIINNMNLLISSYTDSKFGDFLDLSFVRNWCFLWGGLKSSREKEGPIKCR